MPGQRRPKDERFRVEAKNRMERILAEMRKLEDCADKRRFAYTEEQAGDIVAALNDGVERVAKRFNDSQPGFEFGGRGE